MKQPKLVAVDMDGTFLTDAMDYDREHFARLHQRMQERGIRFVVSSGNQYYQLRSFFTDYPDTIYVAENGAYIRDEHQEYAINRYASSTAATIIARLATVPDIHVVVCGVKSAYVLADERPEWIADVRRYYYQLELVDSFEDLDDELIKFAISCPPDETDALVHRFEQLMDGLAVPASSGHGDIDLIQPGVHKAAGLQQLGQVLNVDLADMCAFGDGGNDLEMIREVGLGVAMANASDAVKAVADAETADNNAQGVLTFLDQVLG